MEKSMREEVLKKRVMMECEKRGIGEFIVSFMALYPNYPLEEFPVDQIDSEYFNYYDTSFLASYIRYSDVELLGSGMRDESVRSKLCFLHLHIGTILHAYRKIIWSDSITLEEIKSWLPLLHQYSLKDKILKSVKLDSHFKELINDCLEPNSLTRKNLELLDRLYPGLDYDISDLPYLEDQEAFYKLLRIRSYSSESVPFQNLLNRFHKLKPFLKNTSFNNLLQYQFMIQEYMREPSSYAPLICSSNEFEEFSRKKEKVHQEFLENEYDLSRLKDFFACLFLGMKYEEFEQIFPKLPKKDDIAYEILQEFYQAIFPLALKEKLYSKFMRFGDLRPYLENTISINNTLENLELKKSLTFLGEQNQVIKLQGETFTFFTMSASHYQEHCLKCHDDLVEASVQTNTRFQYHDAQSILVFSKKAVLAAYDQESGCLLRGENLVPSAILTFDRIKISDVALRKIYQIPIVIIETESYVKLGLQQLNQLFEARNWSLYMEQKKTLMASLKEHPWLYMKYLHPDVLYQDVRQWMEYLEAWALESLPSAFLNAQLQVLEQLIALDEEIERLLIPEKKESKTASQYKKRMVQYQKLI